MVSILLAVTACPADHTIALDGQALPVGVWVPMASGPAVLLVRDGRGRQVGPPRPVLPGGGGAGDGVDYRVWAAPALAEAPSAASAAFGGVDPDARAVFAGRPFAEPPTPVRAALEGPGRVAVTGPGASGRAVLPAWPAPALGVPLRDEGGAVVGLAVVGLHPRPTVWVRGLRLATPGPETVTLGEATFRRKPPGAAYYGHGCAWPSAEREVPGHPGSALLLRTGPRVVRVHVDGAVPSAIRVGAGGPWLAPLHADPKRPHFAVAPTGEATGFPLVVTVRFGPAEGGPLAALPVLDGAGDGARVVPAWGGVIVARAARLLAVATPGWRACVPDLPTADQAGDDTDADARFAEAWGRVGPDGGHVFASVADAARCAGRCRAVVVCTPDDFPAVAADVDALAERQLPVAAVARTTAAATHPRSLAAWVAATSPGFVVHPSVAAAWPGTVRARVGGVWRWVAAGRDGQPPEAGEPAPVVRRAVWVLVEWSGGPLVLEPAFGEPVWLEDPGPGAHRRALGRLVMARRSGTPHPAGPVRVVARGGHGPGRALVLWPGKCDAAAVGGARVRVVLLATGDAGPPAPGWPHGTGPLASLGGDGEWRHAPPVAAARLGLERQLALAIGA